ncbi:MAG: hypothetical protein H7Y12_09855 [Sphingobacteriaceae bacterium]|nr:hypothetical protein [Cytophagaceae bacterium]
MSIVYRIHSLLPVFRPEPSAQPDPCPARLDDLLVDEAAVHFPEMRSQYLDIRPGGPENSFQSKEAGNDLLELFFLSSRG